MSAVRLNARAVLALLRRDMQIFASYRLRAVGMTLTMVFSLTLFHYLSRLVRVEPFATPDAYYAFAVIGLVILQVLNSTLGAPPAGLRQELVAGTFERILLSGFGPVGSVLAMLVFPLLLSLGTALVMLGFASVAFGMDVRWGMAPLAVPVGALAAMAFAPFGVILLAVVLVVKQAASGATWVIAGVSLVAGLYFPVELLPDWIQWASSAQPFTPAVDLLRNVLVGTPLPDPAWLDVARLAGFAVVLMPLAAWCVDRAVRIGRRRGTLTEY